MPPIAISLTTSLQPGSMQRNMNAQTTLTCILIAYSIWSTFWICFNFSKFILVSAERDLLQQQNNILKLDLALNELQQPSKTKKVQTIMNNNQQPLETILDATETTFSCSGQELLEANNEITQAFIEAGIWEAEQPSFDQVEVHYPYTNLASYTIRELKALAKDAGIRNYSRWTKAQLISALS